MSAEMRKAKRQRKRALKQTMLITIILLGILFTLTDKGEVGEVPTEQATRCETTPQAEEKAKVDTIYQNATRGGERASESLIIKYGDRMSEELIEYTTTTAKEFGVDANEVMAIIEVESGFNENAISSTADYGLMQINQINHTMLADELGITNILEPKQNILSGIYILAHLQELEVNKRLMAYNMGVTGARRLWAQGIYNSNYSNKVLSVMED